MAGGQQNFVLLFFDLVSVSRCGSTPVCMRLNSFFFVVCFVAGTLAIADVQAEAAHLTLKAEAALTFDNNLFRLPAATNTLQVLGKVSGAEQIGVTTLSLNFSQALSLQKVNLSVSAVDSKFQNFNYLNYTSYNYNAALQWSLTPRLHGLLSADRNETANSFADYTGRQSNLRTEASQQLDAEYEIDGPWRVLAGVSTFSQTNQQALVAGGDHTTRTLHAGLGYVFASGSRLNLIQKQVSGHYLNRKLVANSPYDSDFNQSISDLRAHWAMPENQSADFYLTALRQTHPHFPERNFSGLNSGASLNWLLTGKSSVQLGQSRTVTSYAVRDSNYTQTQRLFVSPSWQFSPKSLVRLQHSRSRIRYLGAPQGVVPSQREDNIHDTGVTFYWQPDQRFTLSAALQNASRSANQTGLDYESQQISVSAQYSY